MINKENFKQVLEILHFKPQVDSNHHNNGGGGGKSPLIKPQKILKTQNLS
ncbi:hypothetical protein DCO58_03825 [Helicobacter saguini]|nr:hypothetical protein [Helicobacter saguini]MWV66817.1 hypothetical protein [Helicobacter saguini]